MAKTLGVGHRIYFEDAVPFDQIIPRANGADIGYFVHKDISPQKKFVLPNKFFEYIMAGLALCVSDLPEMAKLTNHYNLGILVSDYDEKTIAQSINKFTSKNLTDFKRAAVLAAQDLNWTSEKVIMQNAYNSVMLGEE